jgi:catechol 2,3-dioxygenase-like lactoylglutathione lyase family enzyme
MAATETETADMKLEVVVIGVSDVDRAKAFYEKLGWRLDADIARGDFRAVQLTPHNSPCSIIFGRGITTPQPGASKSLTLAVNDINAAREELIRRGAKVSEVFRFAAGPFNDTGDNPRVNGCDPEGRSYFSFASFTDPDGNGWLPRKSQRGFPGANGFCTKRSSITANTRRRTANITGGIGTRRISTRV